MLSRGTKKGETSSLKSTKKKDGSSNASSEGREKNIRRKKAEDRQVLPVRGFYRRRYDANVSMGASAYCSFPEAREKPERNQGYNTKKKAGERTF